jgi:hypothetical protein
MSLKQVCTLHQELEERLTLEQEIETWVQALSHYDNNEYEESLRVFDGIADTSKILFNCGVIHATIGEHERAVRAGLLERGERGLGSDVE